ncbi:MAG: phage antirepressor KilAC domain-containing protein [Clostridia bacterium]
MNAVTVAGDRRMTVREVADALGTAESTIRNKVAELFPDSVRNGIATMLSEQQVFEVKRALVPRDLTLKSKVEAANTDLEMAQKAAEVIGWAMAKLEAATVELAIARPKAEAADALMASTQTMSITDAAKHFGLHPKAEVFPYLRARGYLTEKDLPTQSAIDAGYLALRETKCLDGECRPQAVVLASQLDTWRQRVVPQIRAWRPQV